MNSTIRCNPHCFNDSHAATNKLDQQHPSISLFVYGTLKRGFANHDRFCRNAIDIRPATTWGRLYQIPAGYPAIEIPASAILAHGTANPLADATTQVRLIPTIHSTAAQDGPSGGWDLIHGELIILPDSHRDLPPIDRLEGFFPSGTSLYQRVLIPIFIDIEHFHAWAYVMQCPPDGLRLRHGRWGDC